MEQRQAQADADAKSLQNMVMLIKNEISDKKLGLKNLANTKATKEMIRNAKQNRPELATIFRQFIKGVTINATDRTKALLQVFVGVDGVTLKGSLRMELDLSALKKKKPVFRYKAFYDSEDLRNDTGDSVEELMELTPYTNVSNENVLWVLPGDDPLNKA